jgi:phosphohistidine phosphatase
MGFSVDAIVKDQRMYGAGVSDMLAVLRDCPAEASRVLLVGHNPGLEDMVEYLSCEEPVRPVDGKLMPTATLAWFVFTCGWDELSDGCATLKSITRPADMSG